MSNNKIRVGILGATGTVGQKFVLLLSGHPQFEIAEVVASERSAGKTYGDATAWKQSLPIPKHIAGMTVKSTEKSLDSTILFSGLDSGVAGPLEGRYAEAGYLVISNAKNHRMDPDVPLVIPEINPDHLSMVPDQRYAGGIITNSNCSTMFLAMALAPLRPFGIEAVQVTTMQAISGAGYPGVASMDILGNVVPFIGGEEEKLEHEAAKILGTLKGNLVEPAPFVVSAQCNRVPVYDGHMETVSVKLASSVSPEQIIKAMEEFAGLPQEKRLPNAPPQPILVTRESDRPQPALDVWVGNGMAALVGRVRRCPVLDIKFVVLGHNTIRGAAGAAVLNAEAYLAMGLLKP